MNISYFTTHLPPDVHFGGVVHSGKALLTELEKRVDNIKCLSVSKKPDAVIKYNNQSQIYCAKSIVLHRWGFAPGYQGLLKDHFQNTDLALINGIMNYPMTLAGHFCIKHKIPYMVTLRGGLLPYRYARKHLRKKMFFDSFVRIILDNSSTIHATCQEERDAVRNMGIIKAPITIISNGVDFPPNDITEQDLTADIREILKRKRVVLFMSRLDPIKGLDILLDAWGNLNKYHQNFTLVIAGPDDCNYLKQLNQRVKKNNIENSVFFPGTVRGRQKWALYKYSDIFVLPTYSENFGLVVGEALACKTPVITTAETPWKNLPENIGRIIKTNTKELENALINMITKKPEQLHEMGTTGFKYVQEKYSWDNISKKVLAVLNNIINKEPIPLNP